MDDIVAFVRARLDEEEQEAETAQSVIPADHGWYVVPQLAAADPEWLQKYGRAYKHIAQHDPARDLADVHAKRRILALRESWALQAQKAPPEFRHVFEAQMAAADAVVLSLASAWFNHPDYDPEWSPVRDTPATSD